MLWLYFLLATNLKPTNGASISNTQNESVTNGIANVFGTRTSISAPTIGELVDHSSSESSDSSSPSKSLRSVRRQKTHEAMKKATDKLMEMYEAKKCRVKVVKKFVRRQANVIKYLKSCKLKSFKPFDSKVEYMLAELIKRHVKYVPAFIENVSRNSPKWPLQKTIKTLFEFIVTLEVDPAGVKALAKVSKQSWDRLFNGPEFEAVRSYGIRKLLRLLANSMEILIGNNEHLETSIFVYLIKTGQEDIVDLLIRLGLDLDVCPKYGTPSSVYAAKSKDYKLFYQLRSRVDLSMKYSEQKVDYIDALVNENFDKIKNDFLDGNFLNETFIDFDLKKVTAFSYCVKTGNAEMLELLTSSDAHSTRLDLSLLTLAIENGHIKIIRALLEKGIDVNISNANGLIAFEAALDLRDPEEIIQILIEYGLDIHVKFPDGSNSVGVVAHFGQLTIAQMLVRKGKTILNFKDQKSPLVAAFLRGNHKIMKLLLENGCDPNEWYMGKPLLYHGSSHGTECFKVLLDFGAKIDHACQDGESIWDNLIGNGDLNAISTLLRHGHKNSNPKSLFKIYNCNGKVNLLQAYGLFNLFRDEIGFNVHAWDDEGITHLGRAKRAKDKAAIEYLETYGAKMDIIWVDKPTYAPFYLVCAISLGCIIPGYISAWLNRK